MNKNIITIEALKHDEIFKRNKKRKIKRIGGR